MNYTKVTPRMTDLQELKDMPDTINNVHASCFKSYQLLDLVLMMIERGDSKETISMVVRFVWPDKTKI